jgi:inner membrane protein
VPADRQIARVAFGRTLRLHLAAVDNLTHSLFGWTLARAGLGRRVPHATATLILASNAPDVDVVAGFRSGVDYLAAHRGPTHGPLGVIGLGLITAGIIAAWSRWRSPNRGMGVDDGRTRHFTRWWILAMIGVVCHVLMDLPTSYGTRLLSPFIWTWYALDWMPIIDVYLWVMLAVALVVGSKLRRERVAMLALGLMAFDYAARAALHERALANAAAFDAAGVHAPCTIAPTFVAHSGSIAVSPRSPNACVEAAALPTFLSPFTWRSIRRHADSYELSDRKILGEQATASLTRLASDTGADVVRARASRAGQVYFDFARFPVAQVSVHAGTFTSVRLLDARFMMMPLASGNTRNARLSVTITFDESGRTVEERFGN